MDSRRDKKYSLQASKQGSKYQENASWYVRIAGLLAFSTILPLNIHTTIKEMAYYTWLWPLIGGLIGLFVGLLGLIFYELLLPPLLTAGLVYSFILFFTGFHHLDGLIDMGDAIMAHGNAQKKIEIMRDSNIGTGGISIFFIVAIITLASISALPPNTIFFTLLIAEIGAKLGLVTCCTLSIPAPQGTGSYFIKAMNPLSLILILLISLAIGFLTLNWIGIIGLFGAVLGGIIVTFTAKKHFITATGDVLGAANEIARLFTLLLMVIAFLGIT